MSTFTWRGGDGTWDVGSNWDLLRQPDPDGTALLAGTGPYTVTIDAAASVTDIVVATAGVALDVAATLALGGTITLGNATTLDLAGVLLGGTLDLTGGGTLDGDGGTLDGTTVFGEFSQIAGAGALDNQGDIGWATTGTGSIDIASASFTNAGVIALVPVTSAENGIFPVDVQSVHGKPITTYGSLSWTQTFAASLVVSSASFDNAGQISLDGGTLSFSGASFVNTGQISLADVATQSVQPYETVDGSPAYAVMDGTLTTAVLIAAGASFDNAGGTITADSMVFGGPVTLAELGTLTGAITIDSTLDLQGGTLDAANVTILGTIKDGTINAGTLVLNGATLDDVMVAAGGSVQSVGHITLVDPPASQGTITLDGTTTELDFTAGASSDATVIAGDGSVTDIINLVSAGAVTLGAAFRLTNSVAGGSLVIGGAGALMIEGVLSLDGSALTVSAATEGSGTIELANGATATLTGLAADATPVISFGPGSSQAVLPGTGALSLTLAGLQPGDEVDFVAISSIPNGHFGTGGAVASGGSLDVVGASGDSASVPLSGDASGLTFQVVTDGAGGTKVVAELACFVAGTRIATPDGARAVEALRPGDLVRTQAGRAAPVRWVGWTRVDFSCHPAPERAAPIRIVVDAFAAGLPQRDLLVSPEHCIFIDGSLVPAFLLTNGATIARDDSFAAVTYWHVELDRHDVLLAEGLPAESYLDTGNRAVFAGQAGARTLHTDFWPAPAPSLAIWAARGCAPLRLSADDARAALRARAEHLGWRRSDDPELRVFANDAPVAATATDGGVLVRLPAGTDRVRLTSGSFVPAETSPDSGDTRRLGVAVAGLKLAGWPLHPDALARGWHAARGEAWRWTDGDALVRIPKLARASVLEIGLLPTSAGWQPPQAPVMRSRTSAA